jgi:hypothetical protein
VSPARAGTSAVVAVLGAAALLLVLVTWASSIGPDRVVSGGHVERIRPDEPSVTPTSEAPVPDPVERARQEERGEPPGWLVALGYAVRAATVAVLAWLALRGVGWLRRRWRERSRRPRGAPEEVEFEVLGTPEQVAELLEEGAAEQRALLLEGEPRNAVVACWHRFEVVAGRAGVARQPWQTTGEFVLEVLELVGADRGAVARLADLYREARFSDHLVGEDDRRAAVAALDAVHDSLRHPARSGTVAR